MCFCQCSLPLFMLYTANKVFRKILPGVLNGVTINLPKKTFTGLNLGGCCVCSDKVFVVNNYKLRRSY